MIEQTYLTFHKHHEVAKDTFSFYFDKPKTVKFKSGQYITLHFTDKNDDWDDYTHDFTIASSPLDDFIMITTKTTSHSKFKTKLLELKEGDKLRYTGPQGAFLFDERVPEYVFLAGGIGITPYHSMLNFIMQEKLSIKVTLFASFSLPEEMVFYEELKKIAENNPNIKIVYTVTKPEESQQEWQGETGRITPELIKKYVQDIMAPRYFITGPPAMVDAMEELVLKMGVLLEQIYIEHFTGY